MGADVDDDVIDDKVDDAYGDVDDDIDEDDVVDAGVCFHQGHLTARRHHT